MWPGRLAGPAASVDLGACILWPRSAKRRLGAMKPKSLLVGSSEVLYLVTYVHVAPDLSLGTPHVIRVNGTLA